MDESQCEPGGQSRQFGTDAHGGCSRPHHTSEGDKKHNIENLRKSTLNISSTGGGQYTCHC